MSRTIEINPVTRIEGHARVTIQLADDGQVESAEFHVLEFRGFERFVQGMHVEMMPTVTSRICGTCPHAHHLVASKAVDRVFGVTIPRPARLLRELLNAGSIIHSHAIHFFALAGPDLFLGLDAAPERRNLMALLEAAPELAQKALRLRSIGQRIAEEVGGRGTHPVTCVVGGMASPLGAEAHRRLTALLDEALGSVESLVQAGFEALRRHDDVLARFSLPMHDLASTVDGVTNAYDGQLRVTGPDGGLVREFPVEEYREHLSERALPHSYAKEIRLRCDDAWVPYRVGPLARLNVTERLPTPLADAALAQFRQSHGRPCHATVAQHHARLIELLHQVELARELLADPEILSEQVRETKLGPVRRGVAHVEAPRGLLIHDFEVDERANVIRANLLVATQHNISGINQTVVDAARHFLAGSESELLNGIEFAIRCYDPCLSCSTHAVGQMPLDVRILAGQELVRRIVR